MSIGMLYDIFCRDMTPENSIFNKDLEKDSMAASKDLFERKTKPSLMLANQVGNMYTPSVYGGLASYILWYDIYF